MVRKFWSENGRKSLIQNENRKKKKTNNTEQDFQTNIQIQIVWQRHLIYLIICSWIFH